jgi:alkanesulfonate monooxygenase SsuD/methylene tetrahydromethanopterin reductase-like flavin-dependent oxidoreductase (luciferase family)
VVKTGVVLPSFRETPHDALAVAEEADELGIDGVFCYDHLWPMGQPHRPALAPFPVLAAVARRTRRVHIGTLVARVGLVPEEVLVSEFGALSVLAPGRVIAGLGTGDRLSHAENEAYGVPTASADERRSALERCVVTLRARGLPVWVGGGSRRTQMIAEATGAAVNLWAATPDAVAEQRRRSEVTWGGPMPGVADGPRGATPQSGDGTSMLAQRLFELEAAGASWVVFAWPVPMGDLVACASALGAGR